MRVIAEGVSASAKTVVLGVEAGQWVVVTRITPGMWATSTFDALDPDGAWERFRDLAAVYVDARNLGVAL